VKYFYDTEFDEDGRTIELISLAMVAEDGREFYRVSNEFEPARCNAFVQANVLPHLPAKDLWIDRKQMRTELLDFIGADEHPELWAYYAAYDHVALAQLWGPMIDLPKPLPMWTNDLMQECQRLGNPKLPEQSSGEHDALEDARWLKHRYEWLQGVTA